MVKIRQQLGSGIMVGTRIIAQTIIGPFAVDEKITLNSANFCYFMGKTFFA